MFRRIANLFRGFIGLFISGVEKTNPEALLEVEKENLRKQIAQYNQGLAHHAGLCEKLMSQVRRLEKEENDFRAKATAHLNAGNRDAAAQFALRLQTIQRELMENRAQLEQAELTYKDLFKARDVSVQTAQAKIEALKNGINDLKIKRATAELAEMASGLISNIGGAGDTLDRLQGMVEEERQAASGRARVAKDNLNFGEFKIKETEQKALADQALSDFASREGIPLKTPDTISPPPTKSMGPQAGS
jgi:phage shock protein A